MARALALAAAIAVSFLAVSGAGGAGAQMPKRGGTVVIGTATFLEPACLNPLVNACRPAPASVNPVDLVFDGAFDVTPDAAFRPDLVSRVDVVSRKPFTLRYHIKPAARWSDGVPITARDFEFTHKTIRVHRPDGQDLHWTKVRSVRALDTKTVRVVLSALLADWRFLFEWVLPRHALAGADLGSLWQERVDNPKTGRMIGSGPFLVERLERGKQLTLVRNPRYWGSHTAYLERVVWRFIPANDAAEALRRGEVDMIHPVPVLQAAALALRREGTPGIRVLPALAQFLEHLAIRTRGGGHPALENPLVRQALAYGIDRDAIARAAGELAGVSGAAFEPLDSFVFVANSPYYQPNWKGYRHRPALSRRLLERAGCRRGDDGIYSCAGERLSLRLATVTGVERRARTVELAQAQLRQVGVDVTPEYRPQAGFFEAFLESRDFDLALFGWSPSTAYLFDVFGCQRPSNFSGYCSRLVTRDLDQATRILDDKRRALLLNGVDARLAKAVPAIPLFQAAGLLALKSSIRGVVANGAGAFTWNAEDWWLAQ